MLLKNTTLTFRWNTHSCLLCYSSILRWAIHAPRTPSCTDLSLCCVTTSPDLPLRLFQNYCSCSKALSLELNMLFQGTRWNDWCRYSTCQENLSVRSRCSCFQPARQGGCSSPHQGYERGVIAKMFTGVENNETHIILIMFWTQVVAFCLMWYTVCVTSFHASILMEKPEKENPLLTERLTDPGHVTSDEIMVIILMRQRVLASQQHLVQHQRIFEDCLTG